MLLIWFQKIELRSGKKIIQLNFMDYKIFSCKRFQPKRVVCGKNYTHFMPIMFGVFYHVYSKKLYTKKSVNSTKHIIKVETQQYF